ncbi:hypoxanthine phosphoribosyltransferase [Periweissella beninensis]|uniref:hypoxanthine phosphoribosyltransferase n=1 Tax=Periweissella beninensis TaxID=504936 RepID=UPI0021A4B576|nr:hypoxanthine phosphoribosyltransferase [Periweissella beninensis]MCT4396381.1 hypoxanthine phosphoribosyltransferase [Periweissella beninensis]
MNKDIERVLYSVEDIQNAAKRIGNQLAEDYADKTPILLSVLKGAILWSVDVMREMDSYVELDFIDVSSYHGGVESAGEITLRTDLTTDVAGRDIIILEDIVDTGRTLKYMIELLHKRGAASVKVASLLDKKEGRVVDVAVDYVGFDVPKAFVVGYGLDYKELYRNLPYVGILKPKVYSEEDSATLNSQE